MLFKHHYAVMAELLVQEPSQLKYVPPADRFFVDFYWKQTKRADKCKVALLREQLLNEEIDDDEARRAAPGPNLKLAAAKARWQEKRVGSERA